MPALFSDSVYRLLAWLCVLVNGIALCLFSSSWFLSLVGLWFVGKVLGVALSSLVLLVLYVLVVLCCSYFKCLVGFFGILIGNKIYVARLCYQSLA